MRTFLAGLWSFISDLLLPFRPEPVPDATAIEAAFRSQLGVEHEPIDDPRYRSWKLRRGEHEVNFHMQLGKLEVQVEVTRPGEPDLFEPWREVRDSLPEDASPPVAGWYTQEPRGIVPGDVEEDSDPELVTTAAERVARLGGEGAFHLTLWTGWTECDMRAESELELARRAATSVDALRSLQLDAEHASLAWIREQAGDGPAVSA